MPDKFSADGPPTPKALADELERLRARVTEDAPAPPWDVILRQDETTGWCGGIRAPSDVAEEGELVVGDGETPCMGIAVADFLVYAHKHAAEILAALRENERMKEVLGWLRDHGRIPDEAWGDSVGWRKATPPMPDPASHEATHGQGRRG